MNKRSIIQGLGALVAPLSMYSPPAASYSPRTFANSYQSQPQTLASLTPLRHIRPDWETPRAGEKPTEEIGLHTGALARELVIVDAGVPQREWFQYAGAPGIEVVKLSAQGDALAEVIELLNGYHELRAIHLISHGESGVERLGDARLDADALKARPTFLAAFNNATLPGADLLLYGYDLAAESEALLDIVQQQTHLDVAASNDKTGAEALGGNWELEITRGEIDAELPFSEAALKDFTDILAPTAPTMPSAINETPTTNKILTIRSITLWDPIALPNLLRVALPHWVSRLVPSSRVCCSQRLSLCLPFLPPARVPNHTLARLWVFSDQIGLVVNGRGFRVALTEIT